MVIRATLVILIVGLAGLYGRVLTAERTSSGELPDLRSLPMSPGGWHSEESPLEDDIARVLDADATLQRRYTRSDGSEVWLFLAYFAEQQVNSQIHSPKHCVPGSGWAITSTGDTELDLSDRVQPATHLTIRRHENEWDMYYWFQTRGGTVTGEYGLKWDLVKNSLSRRPTDAVFVRYSASRANIEPMRQLISELDRPMTQLLAEVGLGK